MRLFAHLFVSLTALTFLAGACQRSDGPADAAPLPPAPMALAPGVDHKARPASVDVQKARQIYQARCRMCHGEQGQANGPMAATVRPTPRSFADPAWQKSTTDAAIADIVVRGGAGVGRSASMPAAPDLGQQPAVVAGLVQLVRSFGPAEAPSGR